MLWCITWWQMVPYWDNVYFVWFSGSSSSSGWIKHNPWGGNIRQSGTSGLRTLADGDYTYNVLYVWCTIKNVELPLTWPCCGMQCKINCKKLVRDSGTGLLDHTEHICSAVVYLGLAARVGLDLHHADVHVLVMSTVHVIYIPVMTSVHHTMYIVHIRCTCTWPWLFVIRSATNEVV